MRSSFAEREEAIEKKFQHDNEKEFKIKARRNRLFGYWAGSEIGLTGADLESYCDKIVNYMIKAPKDSVLIKQILDDFNKHNVNFTGYQVEKKLQYFYEDARKEIQEGIVV